MLNNDIGPVDCAHFAFSNLSRTNKSLKASQAVGASGKLLA